MLVENNYNDGKTKEEEGKQLITKNVILSDGTYATQTVYSEPKAQGLTDNTIPLRERHVCPYCLCYAYASQQDWLVIPVTIMVMEKI